MANLSDSDRAALWADFMRHFPEGETCSVNKTDLRAAVNAIDTWLNTNAAALNSAIPQPARSGLTTPQKARLLQYVVARRYLSGA